MIPFDSYEGRCLRDIGLSRSAVLALWAVALELNQMDWAEWARAQPMPEGDPNRIALQYFHAAARGQLPEMREFATRLTSLQSDYQELFYVRNALALVKLTSV